MNEKIEVGEINTLQIIRDTDHGFFLESLDGSEVLLPNAPEDRRSIHQPFDRPHRSPSQSIRPTPNQNPCRFP
ncbi:MAG: S1-like domain-containing RNA-binding protein [Arcobacteraceae bacterium]